mmetsp:Transcript_3166/g.9645  ORF Transcript_3166/g.9645 Transcript_3166/m.9645 type:complete len:273 (-) Transcript_3166:314-1132(-)
MPAEHFIAERAFLEKLGIEAELFAAVAAAEASAAASPREALERVAAHLAKGAEAPSDAQVRKALRRRPAASSTPKPESEPAHAAHHGPPAPEGEESIGAMVAGRTGWLAFFLCGLLLCERVMHAYEALLEKELELAFFVPLIIGHGGNSGGQAVSTVIRAIGRRKPSGAEAVKTVMSEAVAGLLQSLLLAIAVGPSLHFLLNTSRGVSAVVAITLPLLGVFANSMGALLPFAVSWSGLDPAVIVGPLMTTLVDTLGLVLYLSCATFYLKWAA